LPKTFEKYDQFNAPHEMLKLPVFSTGYIPEYIYSLQYNAHIHMYRSSHVDNAIARMIRSRNTSIPTIKYSIYDSYAKIDVYFCVSTLDLFF